MYERACAAGNWDKTAATITAPVLAVLLTDEATAASLNPGPRPVDENTAPAPSVSGSTRMSPPVAAPANSAAAAAAAARTAAEAIGLRKVSSQGSAEVAAPAPASPGVPVPFSMEQLALAMLRVFQRSDHVGAAPVAFSTYVNMAPVANPAVLVHIPCTHTIYAALRSLTPHFKNMQSTALMRTHRYAGSCQELCHRGAKRLLLPRENPAEMRSGPSWPLGFD